MSVLESCETANKVFKTSLQENMSMLDEDNRKRTVLQKNWKQI